MILKIEDCSLLLILIAKSFSSLTSSFYDFNVLIISLSKHHESFDILPTDPVPYGSQQLICSLTDKLTIIFNFGSFIHFLSLVQVWGCVIFSLYPKITV